MVANVSAGFRVMRVVFILDYLSRARSRRAIRQLRWRSWLYSCRGRLCVLGVQVALHDLPFNLHVRWIDLPANLPHMRATACELTSHPAVFFNLRRSKRNMLGPRLSFFRCGLGHRFLEELRIWMERPIQNILYRSRFDDKTAQHDPDAVADVVGRRQVVCNVKDADLLFIPQFTEQVDNFHA